VVLKDGSIAGGLGLQQRAAYPQHFILLQGGRSSGWSIHRSARGHVSATGLHNNSSRMIRECFGINRNKVDKCDKLTATVYIIIQRGKNILHSLLFLNIDTFIGIQSLQKSFVDVRTRLSKHVCDMS